MRLKLNRTLRAALIAAITAVGTTLPQAFADAQTLTLTSPGGAQITGGNQPITWSESTGQLTSWQLQFEMTCTSATDPFIRINGNDGYCVKSSANSLQITKGFDNSLLTLGDLSLGTSTPVTIKFIADVDDTAASLGTGTFYISTGDNTNVVSTKVSDITFASGTSNPSLVSNSSRIWTNGGVEKLYNISVTKLDNNVVAIPTSTWNGKLEEHDWADSVWDTGTYQDGNKAVFGADGYNEVTVSAATSASSVSVSEQEYTFEIADGGALTAAKTNIEDSGSLTIVGAGSATITTLSGAGDLTVGENGTATVNGLNSYTGTLGVVDGGTLNLGSSVTLDSLTVADGTVTTQHSSGSGVVANTLTIGQDGTFKVIGEHDAFGYNNGATKKIDMTGAEGHLATLALEQTTGNSVTMTTNIAMHGYSVITVKDGGKGFNTYGGNITVENKANSIAVIDLRNDVAIDVAEDGELSVGKFTRNKDATATLSVTKAGAGIMTITGDSSLSGALNISGGTVSIGADTTIAGLNIAAEGTLAVTAGTTTVSGTSNVLSSTISVTGGALTLNGTYEIGGNTGEMKTTYVGGAVDGNGFEHVAGSATVYTKAEGATVNDNATYTVGGQEVTVENGVYTTEGTTNYGTFYVKSGEESLAKAIGYAAEHTVNTVSLANGTSINMDSAGASIGLALESGASATVNATEASTLSSITGWTKTLTVAGTAAVTMPGGTMTLAGEQHLVVAGTVTVNTNKIQLDSDDTVLEVTEGATLNITGNNNLTPNKGTVNISGTVNVGHELDLSNGSKATGIVNVGSTGKLSAWGMWMHNGVFVNLAEGGEFSIGQNATKDLTIIGKVGGGSISYTNAAKDANYGTNNADYKITNATVTTTGASVTLGNTLSGVDVFVADGSSLTLNTNADSVTVGNGGTFTLNEGKTVTNITVQDGGTIAGGVNAKEVKIAAAGTATFNEGINEEGVQLGLSESAAVTNMKGEAAAYGGIHDADMQVSTDVLMAQGGDITVENKLVVTAIMNAGLGTLTLTNVDTTQAPQSVVAYMGDVTLQNVGADPIELPNISLYGTTVAAYTDNVATTDHEATVTITDVLEVVGGGTLLANLEMADDSSLLLNGAGDNALVLGSTLDLGTGIKLDAITLQALDAMSLGETLMLVKAADDTDFTYLGEAEWFGQVFSRSASEGGYDLLGDYTVFSEADGFGLTKVSNTPEPTTGTLSLLALAALAARRRRK